MIPNSFKTNAPASTEEIAWTFEEPMTSYNRAVIIAYGSDGLAPRWKPEILRHAKAFITAKVSYLFR